jgi:glycosyltransferase involved in cell wall biosynthesis
MTAPHTFVVPTFGRPAWLADCLGSLRQQTVRSHILITTSTPNDDVLAVDAAHDVAVIVNPVSAGIAADWNFALQQAPTSCVTLAHQDDWYAPTYAERCLEAGAAAQRPLLVFSAADERSEETGRDVGNVAVKRAICETVFLGQSAIAARWRKHLLLAFADPIPCPAVMLYRDAAPAFAFESGWTCGLDWVAWLDLARRDGAFVYVREALVRRRVHPACTTQINLDARAAEDLRILRGLWPAPVAGVIARLYERGHRPYRRAPAEGVHQ